MARSLGYLFPPRLRMKLPYVINSTQVTANAPYFEWVMRGNSLYDPDYTGTGHQALGFDQLFTFYYHYYVAASKFKIRFRSTGNTAAQIGQCYMTTSRDGISQTGLFGSEATVAENVKMGSFPVCPFNADAANKWHSRYTTTKAQLQAPGRTSWDASGLTGGIGTGSNPADQFFWHAILYLVGGASTAVTNSLLFYEIKMIYYAEFSELKPIVGS